MSLADNKPHLNIVAPETVQVETSVSWFILDIRGLLSWSSVQRLESSVGITRKAPVNTRINFALSISGRSCYANTPGAISWCKHTTSVKPVPTDTQTFS